MIPSDEFDNVRKETVVDAMRVAHCHHLSKPAEAHYWAMFKAGYDALQTLESNTKEVTLPVFGDLATEASQPKTCAAR